MAAGDRAIAAAIVVAAGSGSRLGAGVPKAFVHLAGRPLLARAAAGFLAHPRIRDVVVAAPAQLVRDAANCAPAAHVVAGGATRQESVARALAALAPDVGVVLVHDAARALVPTELIDRVLDGVRAPGVAGVVPALPVTDTIRRAEPGTGALGEVVDRSRLLAMQTPQGFIRSALVRAHAEATDADAPDDAALVQALGAKVVSVEGDQRAFKITVARDLELAEAMLARAGVRE
jgi:2-C-methyl-D-erythritol 4-phosphate cytidylyltransferase